MASITGLPTRVVSAVAACAGGSGGVTADASAASFQLAAAAPSAAAAAAAQAALAAAGSAGRVAAFTAAGAVCLTAAGFVYSAPPPPRPPPRPPWPPTLAVAPGASLEAPGAGASHAIMAVRRAGAAAATSTAANVAYALAALLLLWLPAQAAYTAASSAVRRRCSVTLAVAMRCDGVARTAQLVALSTRRLAGGPTRGAAALSAAHVAAPRERVAAAAASGRRFAAPSLAALLGSFFATSGGLRLDAPLPPPQRADVRKLLRKPLLAALRGPAAKPVGALARLRRALAAEAAWNGRELRHAWMTLKRGDVCCGRRAVSDVGKVFRAHAGGGDVDVAVDVADGDVTAAVMESGQGPPPLWVFTEVQLSFGLAGAGARAAAWRQQLRSEAGCAALEAALLDALAADAKGLELDGVGATTLLLMDDAPHSRLGGKRHKAAGGGQGGLDAAVAERGKRMLLICARDDPDTDHEADAGEPENDGKERKDEEEATTRDK